MNSWRCKGETRDNAAEVYGKNGRMGSSEFPSYSPGSQRGSLCRSRAGPTPKHIKLERVSIIGRYDCQPKQTAVLTLYSKGPLKLHIILAFILFSHTAGVLTQASLCHSARSPCPSVPPTTPMPPLCFLNTFGSSLPLWLKNTNVSMDPFFLFLFLVQFWPEGTFGSRRHVPPL